MAEENKGKGANPPQEQSNESLPGSCNKSLGTNQPAKTSWPELVGVTVEEAKKKIKEEMPGADIQVVPPSAQFITSDFGFNRVRLFVYESQKVIRTPVIG